MLLCNKVSANIEKFVKTTHKYEERLGTQDIKNC